MTDRRLALRPQVLLSGYGGNGNFGDEALTEVLVGLIQRAGWDVVILANDPVSSAGRHHVRAVDRRRWGRRIRAIRAADMVIIGGGGLLKDSSRRGGVSAAWAFFDILVARCLGRRALVVGLGKGVVRHKRGWFMATRVLSLAELVIVRDTPTYQALVGAGLSRIFPGTDLVFSSRGADVVGPGSTPAAVQRTGRVGLSLSLHDLRGNSQEGDLSATSERVIRAGAEAISAADQALVYLCLYRGAKGSDVELLPTSCRPSQIHDLSNADIVEALETVRGLSAVIAMRYHAGVLASLAGVPLVLLSYDEKVRHLAADLGCAHQYIDLNLTPPESLPSRLGEALDAALAGRGTPERLDHLRAAADEACGLIVTALTGNAARQRPAGWGLALLLLALQGFDTAVGLARRVRGPARASARAC